MVTLLLARAYFVVVGVAAILVTISSAASVLAGSNYEWWLAVVGIVAGALAVVAGAFVRRPGRAVAAVWAGIAVVVGAHVYLLAIAFTSAQSAIGLTAVPAAIAFAASARLAAARLAPSSSTTPSAAQPPPEPAG